jgi:putative ABC transport system permease protein
VRRGSVDLAPILYTMLRNKLRFGLYAAQIAVTLAIVANCMTLILDARQKMSRPPTFDDENLVTVFMPCVEPELRDDKRRDAWAEENTTRLRGIPGVEAVTSTNFDPWSARFVAELTPVGSDSRPRLVGSFAVDESLPGVLGAEIDEGRWFTREEVLDGTARLRALEGTRRERTSDGKVREPIEVLAVVSRAYGQLVFGEGPLLGKVLEDRDGDRYRIIGVMRRYHAPSYGMHDDDHVVFSPFAVHSYEGTSWIVRSAPGSTRAVAQRIEERLWETYGDTTEMVRLVSEGRDIHYGPQRMTAALMGLLVILLLLVASLGVAGLTSFSVTERTRQIGTRRALGATTADILWYFLTESGLLTTVGLSIGAGLAVALNIVLLNVYTGAKIHPGTVAASALVLWIVGIGAALPPALRASRTSPAIATRNV